MPKLLTPTPEDAAILQEFSVRYMNILRSNSELCVEMLKECPPIRVVRPKGAMYVMFGIDFAQLDGTMQDDAEFSQKLLQEENLIILPGQCFGMHNFVRLVTCPPSDVLIVALNRIKDFCARHSKLPAPPADV